MFKLFSREVFDAAGDEGAAGGGGAAPAAPAAAPAPAPAPVKEATPTQPTAQPEPTPQEPEKAEYEPTGDPTLDYVLGYIGEQGFGQDHPAVQAAFNGDFALLEVELAKKGAPGADKILAMAQRSYEQAQGQQKERDAATGQALVEVAGSLEQWESVVGWARENADDSEKEAINGLLQQGGLQAKIAARYLVEAYKVSQGTSFEGKPAVAAGAAPAQAPASNAPLTRAQFATEAEKLYRQFGDAYQQRPEYQQLVSRRAR